MGEIGDRFSSVIVSVSTVANSSRCRGVDAGVGHHGVRRGVNIARHELRATCLPKRRPDRDWALPSPMPGPTMAPCAECPMLRLATQSKSQPSSLLRWTWPRSPCSNWHNARSGRSGATAHDRHVAYRFTRRRVSLVAEMLCRRDALRRWNRGSAAIVGRRSPPSFENQVSLL